MNDKPDWIIKRIERQATQVKKLNRNPFLDLMGNPIKIGDQVHFHTFYGAGTGKIVEMQWQMPLAPDLEPTLLVEIKLPSKATIQLNHAYNYGLTKG